MRDIADLKLENILLDVDAEGIATVTLNRPDKRNALDIATIDELVDIFDGYGPVPTHDGGCVETDTCPTEMPCSPTDAGRHEQY